MRVLDEEKWERTVRRAMEKAGGSVPDAAAILEISLRQMFRILSDDRFKDVERVGLGKPVGAGK